MRSEPSWVEKVRYYSSVSGIYLLTLLFAFAAIHPAHRPIAKNALLASAVQPAPQSHIISGMPVRLVIPASGIDLPVDPGYYDAAQASWTLSGYRAQY